MSETNHPTPRWQAFVGHALTILALAIGGLSSFHALKTEVVELRATVTTPAERRGTVVFAHGSGSGRHSPRNQFVAKALNDAGFTTVLADLLTPEEERVDVRCWRRGSGRRDSRRSRRHRPPPEPAPGRRPLPP